MASKCVAEPDQSPPHVVQDPPTNETAELAIDYDFVEQPDQDYFCPVSLELLVEPHQTSCCGHHISQQAANRLGRERKPCPMCKKDKFGTHEDLYFKRKVRQLKVRCPYKKSGCEWTGELGDLNHHITACPKRPWKCQYCDFKSIYEMGPTDHTPNCANYPLPCPNQCEIGTVPRCQADSHLLECPLQLVECEFAGNGCDVKVPRRDLAGHMTENAQHHLMTATLLNLRLTKELHQKMEEKDQQIVELKQQLTEQETKRTTKNELQQQTKDIDTKLQQQTKYLDTKRQQQTKDLDTKLQQQTRDLDTKLQQQTKDLDTKLQQQLETSIQLSTFTCHTHTLTGFNRCQATGGDGSWYSEPFYNYPGGYKFELNIDTNGYGSAEGTHISPFLYLFKGDYDTKLHWPLKLIVILDMLNQEEDHGDHSATTAMEFKQANSDINYKLIGSTYKFYPLAQLKAKNYLRNNEIKFRLWLKVM
ncbi:TNF receptor-associated factor 5-like [Halichondria panicea]|uniref:TNF receptor-associated factor 5-like n=1 Tax=Halichondria panicea TaxID=6063 RepID=UPI00312B6EE1